LEFARYWSTFANITIFGSTETKKLLINYKIPATVKFTLIDTADNSPVILHQLRRVYKYFKYFLTHPSEFKSFTHCYSASDFMPDIIPALLLKLVNRRVFWVAGFYLFAPSPFSRNSPYNQAGRFLTGLLYFIFQIPSYLLVRLFANYVLVTSDPDLKRFSQPTFPVRGGVTLPKNLSTYLKTTKIYDSVFIGRFHPQKGIMLLPHIWRLVVNRLPNAQLAIIGNGDLEPKLRQLVSQLNLTNNIKLLGFQDGTPKYKIFSQSKIVLHPATYDSGGMASAEAMGFGLPGVSFDLESLRSYYPQGMLKTPCFDQQTFANNIITLLTNQKLYTQISKEAFDLVQNHWLWPAQATNIYNKVIDTSVTS